MTVRINKQPFNFREKLSELERPIGVKGNELMRAETAQDARDLVSAGRKNMIINGDMRIDQRYNGSSRDIAGGTNEYVIDRFMFRDSLSTSFRVQRNALSASTDPPGFRYAVKMSCLGNDISISNTEYLRIQQYIETNNLKCDWGLQNTDYLTLSFWVKSSVPGKYYVNLEDGDASPLYLKPYYINQADTWQKVELTYPPPPSGDWTTSTDNGIGMRITWSLTIGSNYVSGLDEGWTTSYHMAGPDQVNFANTAGNAFWLTGVQLERGRNATEFEHRPYTEELALCQRYYEKFSADDNNGGYATFCHGGKSNNTVIVIEPVFRVPKRSIGATMTWGGSIRFGGVAGVYGITMNSIQNAQLGKHGGYVVLVISSTSNPANGNDGYRLEGSNDPNAYIAFSSEL